MKKSASKNQSNINSLPIDSNEPEICMICHKKTEYLPSVPIGRRKGYVIGIGQLCDSCFAEYMPEATEKVAVSAGSLSQDGQIGSLSEHSPDPVPVILPFEKDGEYFVEKLGKVDKKPVFSFFKRLFDIVIALLFGIIMLLPMAVIAIIIKCSSKGRVFYAHERLGLNGKPIKVIKFRTMIAEAEEDGAQWAMGDDDPRIFPFGRFLRKTRMDELPQWWCVLKNDMSFVGPRPERACFYREFETYVHGFSERLKIKPGLTGHAQVNGGYDLKPEEKIVYDIEYIKKRSIWMDVKILFRTVAVVLKHKGAK